jgi:hypothetical protein
MTSCRDNWSLDTGATTPATSLPDGSGFAEFNAANALDPTTTLSLGQTTSCCGGDGRHDGPRVGQRRSTSQ